MEGARLGNSDSVVLLSQMKPLNGSYDQPLDRLRTGAGFMEGARLGCWAPQQRQRRFGVSDEVVERQF